MARDHDPGDGVEISIPCVEDAVEHCFVEEAVAHPFGDYNVDFFDGEGYFFYFSAEKPVEVVSKWGVLGRAEGR